MIHSFSFKNFYSFKDEGVISFEVVEKAPKTGSYFLSPAKKRLTKVLAVFGHNASGKTNALKPLSFLQWFIISAFSDDAEKEISIPPFTFDEESKNKSSIFSVEFEINEKVYQYFVELKQKYVLREELKIKGTTKFKTLFSRELNESNGKYVFQISQQWKLNDAIKNATRKNSSLLATAFRFEHEESKKIIDFWKKIETNVFKDGKDDDVDNGIFSAANFFHGNAKLKEKANELISKFDLGLKEIDIKQNKEDDKISYTIKGVHIIENKEKLLGFQYESAGTKKLFTLLKNILVVLNRGGIAVLDEFDTDLHPAMVSALLELFISPETNPHNAQIIFSAHSPYILNELDKYQIIFAEKDKKGCSEIWRLDDMEGIRSDDNYYAKYMAGAYGAVPKFDL